MKMVIRTTSLHNYVETAEQKGKKKATEHGGALSENLKMLVRRAEVGYTLMQLISPKKALNVVASESSFVVLFCH